MKKRQLLLEAVPVNSTRRIVHALKLNQESLFSVWLAFNITVGHSFFMDLAQAKLDLTELYPAAVKSSQLVINHI